MKKLLPKAMIASLAAFSLISGVCASQYTSTLSLGKGMQTTGASRNYTAGNNFVSIKPSSFDKVDGLNYTKVKITQDSDYGSYGEIRYGNTTNITSTWKTYTVTFGYQEQAWRKYTFSTKVDGYSYGGIKSNKVIMSSQG